MNQNNREFNIAFSFDYNFLQQAYVLVTSIFSNTSSELSFYCITDCNDGDRDELRNYIEKHGSTLTFLEVPFERFGGLEETIKSHWHISVYYKLMFPTLVPGLVGRLLYLDCDIIVLGDITKIFSEVVLSEPVAGVYDNYVIRQDKIGIREEGKYMNSGVMHINVPEWNKLQITERAIDYAKSNPGNILFVDQDAVNAVLQGNWKRLPERYNFLTSYLPKPTSKRDLRHLANHVMIVHFTLQKPWRIDCTNRFRVYYDKYYKLAPRRSRKYQKINLQGIFSKCKLTVIEFYNDTRWLQQIWRRIKQLR